MVNTLNSLGINNMPMADKMIDHSYQIGVIDPKQNLQQQLDKIGVEGNHYILYTSF